jgi:predicted phosphoribosyltransferase
MNRCGDNYSSTILGSTSSDAICVQYSGTLISSIDSYSTLESEVFECVQYIDFAFEVMGIDLSYEEFKRMSQDEKKAFLRDIKLNKIL